MLLSDTVDVRYRINVNGRNTIQMDKLLKSHGIKGYLKYVNERSVIVAVSREDIKSNRIAMEGLNNENQN